MQAPKFAHTSESFHVVLKNRINEYFATTGKATTGGARLFGKAAFLLLSFCYIYIHLVFFTPAAPWAILLSVLLGACTAAIGFNVMHDGAHGSYSTRKWVNASMGFSLNVLGGNVYLWGLDRKSVV